MQNSFCLQSETVDGVHGFLFVLQGNREIGFVFEVGGGEIGVFLRDPG